jgi:putative phosphoesterase
MKIGVISDIHGNYYSLESVITYANKLGVEHFLVLGDLIGYFHEPDLVIRKLKEFSCTFIRGNHERLLEKVMQGEINIDEVTEKYGPGHQKALEKLDADELNWLVNLPDEQEVCFETLKIKLCHGSPLCPDEYIYPNTSEEHLNQLLDGDHDFVFIGHSHYQFIYSSNNKLLINAGSVGLSRDIGGLANWGVLNTGNRTYTPIKTPYNISSILHDIENYTYNKEYLKNVILRNRQDIFLKKVGE